MPWSWAALTPHPPILVPEVGQGREAEAALSLDGAAMLLKRLKDGGRGCPDILLLLSPHQPYDPGAFFINTAPRISGSLERFGAPNTGFCLNTPLTALGQLADHLKNQGFKVSGAEFPNLTPDHGSQVPLYFMSEIFQPGPAVILANPIGLAPAGTLELGRALAAFSGGGQSWALLASGDLSHRLSRGAPAGYDPEGALFDRDLLQALKSGQADDMLRDWPPERLSKAGECGFRSALVLLGLAGGPVDVLSYEGPFGVGYCHALWQPEAAGIHPYPRLARLAVENFLSGRGTEGLPELAANEPGFWEPQRACFVSIKNAAGELRGCIGTILPTQKNVAEEIMANAVSAAARDPRFQPMTLAELDSAVFSVDILSTPEAVSSQDELDPARWGVIVEKNGLRGLLLPDLTGVETVEAQISIAAAKAGIRDLRDLTVHRFSVARYPEQGDGR